MKTLMELFFSFMKIGAFTFGGGYAMIPLIQKEAVERKKWVTDEDILEIVAIAESTPGPIAVNASTFVGYRTAGVLGAFMGTLGMIIPSFVIILCVSMVLRGFQENLYVQYAFMGVRAGVLALILKAMLNMYRKSSKDLISHGIMLIAFVLPVFFQINVLAVIGLCAVIGLISTCLAKKEMN